MGAYLEIEAGPDAVLPRGSYFWHEVVGTPVTSTTGEALGSVRDVYRSGGAEVYVVAGGPYGEFDVPGVRDFVRIFAPRRGEIVVDVEALDLAPPKSARSGPTDARPRAPRRRRGRGVVRRPGPPRRLDPSRPLADPSAASPAESEVRRIRRRTHLRDPRVRCPDPVPVDDRWAAGRQHPGPDPGAGDRDDPDARPPPVGPRPASQRRRCPVWRWSRDGHAAGADRGRHRRAASRRLARDPPRPGGRGVRRSPGPTILPGGRTSSSSAPATRAWTNGSARSSTSSCRSATTC